ncbi:MAG: M28 family peptidase, partial [Gammaproteobacteria bacterium]
DLKTQSFLSTALDRLGYSPGGEDGSWLQPFEIVSVTTTAPEAWIFTSSGDTITLSYWDEFIVASGVQAPSAIIDDAEVVFVGYGIRAPEYDWDDYKGLDVSGKVLLFLNNDPDWDRELFEGNRRLYYGRWSYKYEIAARLGAAGAIVIHTTPSAGYPFQVVQTSWSGPQFELPAGGEPTIAVEAWVTEEAARRLVALAGHDLARLVDSARSPSFVPIPLGVTTSLRLASDLSRVRTANVAGLLEGRDPVLRDEVVVFTAHHDHLGVGEPDDAGDVIYNGARDNASGVAQILAVAEAIQALPTPPRRSILILFVAAEEQGLLGSAYYALHPTFEPGRIAANVNVDGGNIWGRTRDASYIGYGKSSLDTVVERAAALQGRTVRGDQFPDRGYFYRSDQFNFAKIGVPAVYLGKATDFIGQAEGWGVAQIENWEAMRYHQPSDELDDGWSFDGMIEDAQLAFYIGLTIAEDDTMPTWNAGDEFEAARLAALAARR